MSLSQKKIDRFLNDPMTLLCQRKPVTFFIVVYAIVLLAISILFDVTANMGKADLFTWALGKYAYALCGAIAGFIGASLKIKRIEKIEKSNKSIEAIVRTPVD